MVSLHSVVRNLVLHIYLYKVEKMRKIVSKTVVVLFVVVAFCGCDTAREFVNMLNCTFERKNIDNFRFAGVSFDRFASPTDLKGTELLSVTSALLSGKAPITFNMNVEGKNPNKTTAALEQFEWIFLLDGNEILNGNIPDRFSINAEGTSILPIEIGFDAIQYMDGSSITSLFNFYQNLTGKNASKESNASLKIKPTINGIKFPNYIELK